MSKWTTETPKSPGYYWLRGVDIMGNYIYEVAKAFKNEAGEMRIIEMGDNDSRTPDGMLVEWHSDPIVMPLI